MNPLLFGARMSGNINNNWRIGLMTVQAAKEEDIQLPSINNTVASVQHRIGQRSNISGIFMDTIINMGKEIMTNIMDILI